MTEIQTFLILLLFGLYSTYKNWLTLKRAFTSISWPHTMGVILSSRELVTTDEEQYISRRGLITYQYEVMGRKYESQRIFPGDELALQWKRIIDKKTSAYPAGKTVEVCYDPRKPEYAMLEPGPNWATYLSIIIPGALSLWSILEILYNTLY